MKCTQCKSPSFISLFTMPSLYYDIASYISTWRTESKNLIVLPFLRLYHRTQEAREISKDTSNRHLTRRIRDTGTSIRKMAYKLAFHITSSSRNTLVALGRDRADITTAGSQYSRIQCSFEVDETTGEVMLHDRSTSKTTQFLGPSAPTIQLESTAMPSHDGREH